MSAATHRWMWTFLRRGCFIKKHSLTLDCQSSRVTWITVFPSLETIGQVIQSVGERTTSTRWGFDVLLTRHPFRLPEASSGKWTSQWVTQADALQWWGGALAPDDKADMGAKDDFLVGWFCSDPSDDCHRHPAPRATRAMASWLWIHSRLMDHQLDEQRILTAEGGTNARFPDFQGHCWILFFFFIFQLQTLLIQVNKAGRHQGMFVELSDDSVYTLAACQRWTLWLRPAVVGP